MIKFKNILLNIFVMLIIVGCSSGVDENRLAILTGNKSFIQIKNSYKLSIVNNKLEDAKIYAYWLKYNGIKADPIYNHEMYIKNIDLQLKQAISEIDKKMADINEHRTKVKYRDVSEELKMMYFLSGNFAYAKEVYIPFLIKLKKEILARKK